MPIPGARYRWKGNVRLAFKGDKVVEVKKKGGEAHMVGERASALRKAIKSRKK